MRLEHSFTVPVPVDDAWQVLLDLPRVAPCMPGATLTGQDGEEFTGTVKVKLGPIGLTYQGKGRFVDRDEAAHRVVIEASGRDTRSAGTATARVTATLVPEGDATRAEVVTDLTVTGRPAQFGRGMISEVGTKLVGQFAGCLADTLAGPGPAADQAPPTDGSATQEPATGVAPPAERAEPPPEPPSTAPSSTAPPAEAEPIDLLRLAGGTATARRVAIAVVVALLAWLGLRRWRRRS